MEVLNVIPKGKCQRGKPWSRWEHKVRKCIKQKGEERCYEIEEGLWEDKNRWRGLAARCLHTKWKYLWQSKRRKNEEWECCWSYKWIGAISWWKNGESPHSKWWRNLWRIASCRQLLQFTFTWNAMTQALYHLMDAENVAQTFWFICRLSQKQQKWRTSKSEQVRHKASFMSQQLLYTHI